MGESRDFLSLEWVEDDIEKSLQDAQENLESFLTDKQDVQLLDRCLQQIVLVRGSLQMAGISGASAMVSDMEAALKGLIESRLTETDQVFLALAHAFVQLPPYLDYARKFSREQPLLLLNAMNELRAAYGGPALDAASYFRPSLGQERPEASAEVREDFESRWLADIRKFRQIFQFALIGLIRNDQVKTNLARVANVLARLQQACDNTRINQLWEIGAAYVETLLATHETPDSQQIDMLRVMDKQIKALGEEGAEALDRIPPVESLQALLYPVACSTLSSPHVLSIRQEYGLDAFGLNQQSNSAIGLAAGPDRETLVTAVTALLEELQRIKDTVDLYVRNEVKSNIDLGGLLPSLRQIASTLVMMSLESPRIAIQQQIDHISGHGEAELNHDHWVEMAEALIQVEAELEAVAARLNTVERKDGAAVQAEAATGVVVQECLNSLKKAQEYLQTFLSEDQDRQVLEPVPQLLRAAYGGLSMLSISVPAQLLYVSAQFVEDDVLAIDAIPEPDRAERLAQVLAGLEFYLENYPSNAKDATVLENAKTEMAELGYPVDQSAGISSNSDQTDENFYLDDMPFSEAEASLEQIETADFIEPAWDGNTLVDVDVFAIEPSSDLEPEQQPDVMDFELSDAEVPTAPNSVAESNSPSVDAGTEDSMVDEEILEIFSEEVDEVLAELDQHWPQYCQDWSNECALAESRRGFHTLKGSGRMVGASDLGDLAWTVENLLNQVIDASVVMSADIAAFVTQARQQVPAYMTAFSENQSAPRALSYWTDRADVLVRGEPLPVSEAEELPETGLLDIEAAPAQELELSAEVVEEAAPVIDSTDSDDFAEELPEVEFTESAEEGFIELEDYPAETAGNDDGLVAEEVESVDEDESLETIFTREAMQHIQVLESFLAYAGNNPQDMTYPDELYRAMHTLKGSALMAEVQAISELASACERYTRAMREHAVPVDPASLMLLTEANNYFNAVLVGENVPPADNLVVRLDEFLNEQLASLPAGSDAEEPVALSALQAFLVSRHEPVCASQELYVSWTNNGCAESEELDGLKGLMTELSTAATELNDEHVNPLVMAMNRAYDAIEQEHPPQDELLTALRVAHDGLLTYMDQVAALQDIDAHPEWVEALDQQTARYLDELEQTPVELPEAIEPESNLESGIDNEAETLPEVEVEADPEISEQEPETTGSWILPDVDPEMLDIFLEEAEEIVDLAANAKQRWLDAPAELTVVDELQRHLHTLKGGARMAGVAPIGDLSHELEFIYEGILNGSIGQSPELVVLLHKADDSLNAMVLALKNRTALIPADALTQALQQVRQGGPIVTVATKSAKNAEVVLESAEPSRITDTGETRAFLAEAESQLASMLQVMQACDQNTESCLKTLIDSVAGLKSQASQAEVHELGDLCEIFAEVLANTQARDLTSDSAQQELLDWHERLATSLQEVKQALPEPAAVKTQPVYLPQTEIAQQLAEEKPQTAADNTIRVSSSLLEGLVNLAGETSVFRARVEQQVSNFGYAIDEIGSTIERLREQLRRMEIETEAQIIFRQEREGPEHEGFDPLEMDRYSRMQELSRALVESVSDLLDLKDTLGGRARYTESLLLQQSRVNTELQEGLMKTRMVPFSRLVPRLRRIVRQVSNELGKDVEFKIKNVESELDRTLLERVTAPLEHMLRNAVDHGIEKPGQRKKAGKPEKGTVQISVSREGGDILIEIRDDGAGVDVAAVRKKAIQHSLMEADSELTDQQVLQFIFEAGFSTAKKVTQISGRGVGMDVVNSEIRQLGGSISVESNPGEGSLFLVRVPFTVSINRAMMVNVGDEIYSLPLGSIDGVVRVSPYELEEYYRPDGPPFEYAGEQYEFHYLGDYLGYEKNFQLQNQSLPLPVILVRTGEHAVALQVDSISGSREIVVKPLGPQLGRLPGMSGATILGDGRVVLILDPAALIRSVMTAEEADELEQEPVQAEAQGRLQVMVVDDSVTVRKVASRLLERHGMDVILAKDGVEAMTKLQDCLPEIILLDIEMPRMDGFELASLVRHDERLKHIPIVMISSRTGEKHRERAANIGVNLFMGKPFQEDELMDALTEFTRYERDVQSR